LTWSPTLWAVSQSEATSDRAPEHDNDASADEARDEITDPAPKGYSMRIPTPQDNTLVEIDDLAP